MKKRKSDGKVTTLCSKLYYGKDNADIAQYHPDNAKKTQTLTTGGNITSEKGLLLIERRPSTMIVEEG